MLVFWTISVSPNRCSLSCPPGGLWPSLLTFPHFASRKLPGFEANDWVHKTVNQYDNKNILKIENDDLSWASSRFVFHCSWSFTQAFWWKRHRGILRLGFSFLVTTEPGTACEELGCCLTWKPVCVGRRLPWRNGNSRLPQYNTHMHFLRPTWPLSDLGEKGATAASNAWKTLRNS